MYDLDTRSIVRDDIPFYLYYARQCGGEILEVACGTGRVCIPLARSGFHVTGYDLSEYDSDKQYPLIIVPFRAFQLLIEHDQPQKFLALIHKQLTDKGVFIINCFRPYDILDETWVQEEKEDWVVYDPKSGANVRRTHIRKTIDTKKQITYSELMYYTEKPDGATYKYTEKIAMAYYYEDQLRKLLETSGFIIEEAFGYYDYRPIHHGPELIFVCSKRN